jgi:elongation factor Ts
MEISAKMVGELRERSGAGLMDCKRALVECGGDFDQATTWLRKKGMASAAQKGGRVAADGVVEAYIHTGGRIGVLLQLHCETDFVAKNDQFRSLARDICMHIAAANPIHVSEDQIPADVWEREREIAESQLAGKPPHAIAGIVKGKLEKFAAGICLLKQPFIKNPDITVGDLIRESIGRIGENIRVGGFARFQIGA